LLFFDLGEMKYADGDHYVGQYVDGESSPVKDTAETQAKFE
jgi:hypothetical protein